MTKLLRSIRQLEPSIKSRSAVAQIGRQLAVYLLSAFILAVMVYGLGCWAGAALPFCSGCLHVLGLCQRRNAVLAVILNSKA